MRLDAPRHLFSRKKSSRVLSPTPGKRTLKKKAYHKRMTSGKGAAGVLYDIDKHKKASKNYVVLIDESGDLGKSVNSDPYLVFAASVTDKPEEFSKIAEKYSSKLSHTDHSELKFSKTRRDVRFRVIDDINASDPEIYAAVVSKSHPHWGEKKKMYQQALAEFTEFILQDSGDSNYYIILDEHTAISTESEPDRGCNICRKVAAQNGKDIECKMVKSKETRSLQTHDFVVGAIGTAFNHSNEEYVHRLKKPKYKEGSAYYTKKL